MKVEKERGKTKKKRGKFIKQGAQNRPRESSMGNVLTKRWGAQYVTRQTWEKIHSQKKCLSGKMGEGG